MFQLWTREKQAQVPASIPRFHHHEYNGSVCDLNVETHEKGTWIGLGYWQVILASAITSGWVALQYC